MLGQDLSAVRDLALGLPPLTWVLLPLLPLLSGLLPLTRIFPPLLALLPLLSASPSSLSCLFGLLMVLDPLLPPRTRASLPRRARSFPPGRSAGSPPRELPLLLLPEMTSRLQPQPNLTTAIPRTTGPQVPKIPIFFKGTTRNLLFVLCFYQTHDRLNQTCFTLISIKFHCMLLVIYFWVVLIRYHS